MGLSHEGRKLRSHRGGGPVTFLPVFSGWTGPHAYTQALSVLLGPCSSYCSGPLCAVTDSSLSVTQSAPSLAVRPRGGIWLAGGSGSPPVMPDRTTTWPCHSVKSELRGQSCTVPVKAWTDWSEACARTHTRTHTTFFFLPNFF